MQIESASWEGDAYQDEAGIWCRNAAVQAKRRVWDCRAVYGGTVRLPAYERYRRRMEYEKAEPDVEEMTEIEADPGTLVETETCLLYTSTCGNTAVRRTTNRQCFCLGKGICINRKQM